MDTKYTSGQRVTVRSDRGPVTLVVLENLGKIITVCSEEEYEASKMSSRTPLYVGCRVEDVITS